MWKPNRGAHAARELQMARLRGIAPGSQQSAHDVADAIAAFRQHVPAQTLTAQLATLELELHSAILSHLASVGYRDASHANDAPGRAVFPPTMDDDERVRRIVHDLERLAPSTASDPVNATVCVALCELGYFVLGNDSMVIQLTERTELLNADPFGATPLNEHHVAVAILGATVYGMANERAGETDDALFAYERAHELHERARAHTTHQTPLVDEMERWTETALYRYALLLLHARSPKAQHALQRYEAHASRWPATFRQPQRRVIQACLAPAPAPAAAAPVAPAAQPPATPEATRSSASVCLLYTSPSPRD